MGTDAFGEWIDRNTKGKCESNIFIISGRKRSFNYRILIKWVDKKNKLKILGKTS